MIKYIDAEEFKEWIANWFYKDKSYHPYSKSNTIPVTELYDILEQMPAADVAEVRHGRWEELYENNYKCSVCGSWWTCEETPIESGMSYCPNCGASMVNEDV